jgi:hypothetical protein
LKNRIQQLNDHIERELKMRQLGELQWKSSTSQKVRSLISKQIDVWEKNLEVYHMNLFRQKCYLCALTNDRHLPNPKDLLSQACRTTKATLHKLAAFTPCSFYACIVARQRSTRSKLKHRIQRENIDDLRSCEKPTKCYLTMSSSPIVSASSSTGSEQTILQMVTYDSNPSMVSGNHCSY